MLKSMAAGIFGIIFLEALLLNGEEQEAPIESTETSGLSFKAKRLSNEN